MEKRDHHSVLYGRKKGRIRKSKADLLVTLLPQIEFPLLPSGKISWPLFDPNKPLFVEIGYGAGDHLISQMKAYPEAVFLGCEPFLGGIASFLKKLQENDLPLSSVRLYTKDGQNLLKALPDESVEALFLLFPDPWPKKRHHKRRFFQENTLKEIERCLKEGGVFTFSSDWAEYFEAMEILVERTSTLKVIRKGTLPDSQDPTMRPYGWPMTQFEHKAHQAGRLCSFLVLQKTKTPDIC